MLLEKTKAWMLRGFNDVLVGNYWHKVRGLSQLREFINIYISELYSADYNEP